GEGAAARVLGAPARLVGGGEVVGDTFDAGRLGPRRIRRGVDVGRDRRLAHRTRYWRRWAVGGDGPQLGERLRRGRGVAVEDRLGAEHGDALGIHRGDLATGGA